MLPPHQDIQQRGGNKDRMLALVNEERRATNERKRIERELFDSLRRDKVDSIQKMQVWTRARVCWPAASHCVAVGLLQGLAALLEATAQGAR